MKASDWVTTLPTDVGPMTDRGILRDVMILSQVQAGNYWLPWFKVSVAIGQETVTYFASEALQIGEEGDSVRVSMSQRGAQQVADALGAVLPTEFLADRIYETAEIKLSPTEQQINSTTAGMLAHHAAVEAKVAGRPGTLANEGKHWINHSMLTRRPRWAINYGFFYQARENRTYGHKYVTSIPGVLAIQSPGDAHSWDHADYSQLVVLVGRRAEYVRSPGKPPIGLDVHRMVKDVGMKRFLVGRDVLLNFMRHPDLAYAESIAPVSQSSLVPPGGGEEDGLVGSGGVSSGTAKAAAFGVAGLAAYWVARSIRGAQ